MSWSIEMKGWGTEERLLGLVPMLRGCKKICEEGQGVARGCGLRYWAIGLLQAETQPKGERGTGKPRSETPRGDLSTVIYPQQFIEKTEETEKMNVASSERILRARLRYDALHFPSIPSLLRNSGAFTWATFLTSSPLLYIGTRVLSSVVNLESLPRQEFSLKTVFAVICGGVCFLVFIELSSTVSFN